MTPVQESPEAINARLGDAGMKLHLSEVNGPTMDRLKRTAFLKELTVRVFACHCDAVQAAAPETTKRTFRAHPTGTGHDVARRPPPHEER